MIHCAKTSLLHSKQITICLFLFILPYISIGQEKKRIELLNAESLKYDANISKEYKCLIHNVSFQHEDILMYCDSAHLYNEENKVIAYNNIHIIQNGKLHFYGNELHYNGDTKKALLTGNVKLTDGEITLTTSDMEYDFNTKTAYYSKGAKIIDSENTLVSQFGFYYPDTKFFVFKHKVHVKNKKYTIDCDSLKYNSKNDIAYIIAPTYIKGDSGMIYAENGWYNTKKEISQFNKNAFVINKSQKISGDSLYYNQHNGYGKAIGNIEIIDTTENIILNGNIAETFHKNDSSIIIGLPLLRQIEKSDTLFLHADTLIYLKDTALHKILRAYPQVQFFKTDIQGRCDSLTYSSNDSLFKMFTTPILWADSTQLTANFITLKNGNQELDKIYMYDNSFIITQKDSLYFNQIKGKNITGNFADNKLNKVEVIGNSETLYFVEEDKKPNNTFGINFAKASEMIIYFENNNVKKINFIKQPDAILHPPKEVTKEQLYLKGYIWHKDKRPLNKKDIYIFK